MNLEERVENRKQNFMKPNKFDGDDRSEFAVNLRKKKRQIDFQNKRKQNKHQNEIRMSDPTINNPLIRQILSILESLTSEVQLESDLASIKALCSNFNVSYLLEYPQIVTRLNYFTQQTFTDNASSIVMNLWAKIFTENTSTCKKAVLLIPINSILQAMVISKPKTCQKAFLCLGNLAGDCKEFRIQLFSNNVHVVALQILMHCDDINVYRAASFFYVHMSKEQILFTLKKLDELLSGLRLLIFLDDENVLTHCLYAMHNIIKEDLKKIERFTHFGVIERLIDLAASPCVSISEAALRVLGDITFGDTGQINILIEKGLLDLLCNTICLSSSSLRKESIYMISNIIASGPMMIEEIMRHALANKLVLSLRENERNLLLEVSFIYKNFALVASWRHFEGLLNLGVLTYLKSNLRYLEVEISKNFLIFAEKLLNLARENHALSVFDDFSSTGCVESVELLQKHMNPVIYNKVIAILNYFVTNEEMSCDEDKNLEVLPGKFVI